MTTPPTPNSDANAHGGKPSMKAAIGMGIPTGLIVVAAVAAWWIQPGEFAMTAMIGTLGIAVGWLIGVLASPYSAGEKERFSKYAATVSAFLGGYVLSTIEPTVKSALGTDNLITKPLWGARLMLFLICVICAAIAMYVFRAYTDVNEAARVAMRNDDTREAHEHGPGRRQPGSEIPHARTDRGVAE